MAHIIDIFNFCDSHFQSQYERQKQINTLNSRVSHLLRAQKSVLITFIPILMDYISTSRMLHLKEVHLKVNFSQNYLEI